MVVMGLDDNRGKNRRIARTHLSLFTKRLLSLDIFLN
jgi:hypothetical protein